MTTPLEYVKDKVLDFLKGKDRDLEGTFTSYMINVFSDQILLYIVEDKHHVLIEAWSEHGSRRWIISHDSMDEKLTLFFGGYNEFKNRKARVQLLKNK